MDRAFNTNTYWRLSKVGNRYYISSLFNQHKEIIISGSYTIIRDWLDKCDKVERLDNQRNFEYRIKYELKNAMNKGIGPMSKVKNKDRFNLQWIISIITKGECSIMISSSIHTIFNKKIIDYVEEGESVSQKDIAIV